MATDRFLVIGRTGWIGGQIGDILARDGKTYTFAASRTYDRASFAKELDDFKPTHVINAAGVTGRPNADWCEDHRVETIRSNVIGPMTVADLCQERKIYHMLFSTGCIFEYDQDHEIGGKGYTEEERANYHGSYYGHTKGMLEEMLREYDQTCVLRLRMPVGDDLHPRNFVTKILHYAKVVNVPNSMTVLPELLPLSIVMAERRLVGIYNFCNPGSISHNEVLQLYCKHVDPTFTWTNFTVAEQALVLKGGRSNNTLDHTKLVEALPDIHISEIHVAVDRVMQHMRETLEKRPDFPKFLPRHEETATDDA